MAPAKKGIPRMSKPKCLGSKNIPSKPGIYTMTQSGPWGTPIALYTGQTNNLKRRIQEHNRGNGEQFIDHYIGNVADKRTLRVKYVKTPNPQLKEKGFMQNQKKRGALLPFNLTKGNGATLSKKRKSKR